MVKISAVVITKNEERNIARCLNSLDGLVDEIIVIDSYSTDHTKNICSEYPLVQFIERSWEGFAQTKNFANSLAKYEFILSLDADEELSSELKAELLSLKPQLSADNCYSLNRLTNYCGTWIYHSGWLPDYHVRLFPKEGTLWEGAHVHETLRLPQNIKKNKLQGYLNHYSYYSIDDHLERAKSYTSLGAKKVLSKGENFLLIKGIVNPFLRFIKTFIFKRGFLDGYYGFALSIIASFTVFLKYFKAWQIKKNRKAS